MLPIVEKHQPKIVFYHNPQRRDHRWIGNEAGVAGYPCWARMTDLDAAERAHHGRIANWHHLLAHGDPNGKLWSPAMCDAPIREHEWFWRPSEDRKIQPLKRLVNMYYNSVGRNCNLILGATPDRDGLIPKADFRRYEELGRTIRKRFSKPVASTSGVGDSLELTLKEPHKIDHAIIMEDIARGERVRQCVVEGLVPGSKWQKLCDGVSIGHKRIQQFKSVEVAKVRLECTKSVATPKIRELALYFCGAG